MLTIKWQTRVRKTLPTNYWQKWMRTRYLPKLYFASVEVKTQSQENWFLCFTLSILRKSSVARWTYNAAQISISCLWKMIFLSNRLNSAYVFITCFKLQILAIVWGSVMLLLRKRWSTWMGSKLILNLVVILFPLLFLFFALCLSTVVFWIWGLVCESQWLCLVSWLFACHQNQMFKNNGQAESGR